MEIPSYVTITVFNFHQEGLTKVLVSNLDVAKETAGMLFPDGRLEPAGKTGFDVWKGPMLVAIIRTQPALYVHETSETVKG